MLYINHIGIKIFKKEKAIAFFIHSYALKKKKHKPRNKKLS